MGLGATQGLEHKKFPMQENSHVSCKNYMQKYMQFSHQDMIEHKVTKTQQRRDQPKEEKSVAS